MDLLTMSVVKPNPTAYRFSNPVFALYGGYIAGLNAMFVSFSNTKA
ncbi:MAG: hypothetical protein ACLVML_10490 [Candidatus Gastranaerophilaceae bacterium]|jgi:hypothetical protein|nr:hypothetical protein [Christensenellales bacterium]